MDEKIYKQVIEMLVTKQISLMKDISAEAKAKAPGIIAKVLMRKVY